MDSPSAADASNNQTTQAAAGAGQSSPTDTKNHEADILKFLQEKNQS